jgi:hypothetical protein
VCHREDYVTQAYEELRRAAGGDKHFARRVNDSARRVMAFKKKWAMTLQPPKTPSAALAEKLSRRLWEFSEQVRLEALSREEGRRRPRA